LRNPTLFSTPTNSIIHFDMQLAGIGGPIVAAAPGATSIEDLEALQILAHPLVNVKVCLASV